MSNKTSDIRDLWGIPIARYFLRLRYPSMTSFSFPLGKTDCV